MAWLATHDNPRWAEVFCIINFCGYFQFFSLGLLCRQNEQKVYSLLRNDNIYTLIAVIFIGFFVFYRVYITGETNRLFEEFVENIVLRYSGLLFILGIFVRHSDYLGSDNRLCRAVRFVGRRTLDIYLLHYFFLPTMPYLKEWFLYDGKENVVLEVFVAGAIALGVLLIVLCVSFILRHSQILTKYLFGILPKK